MKPNHEENKHKRLSESFNQLRPEDFDRPQYKYALSLLAKHNPENRKIIEFGGGRAEFSRTLRENRFNVTFVDINPENVKFAQDIGFESKVCDLNNKLEEFPDQIFDGAVMLEVIEHINQSELLLSETNRILKPGGFLILSTPNPYFLWHRLSVLFGKEIVGEGYHFRFYNKSGLERALLESGFSIKFRKPSTAAFGLNLIGSLLGMKRTVDLGIPRFLHGLLARKFYLLAIKK